MNTDTKNPSLFFSEQQLAEIQEYPVPHHIAVIPDGNRRWAYSHETDHDEGHRQGANGFLDIVEAARDLGVKVFTLYTFSTENWERPADEVHALMALLELYLKEQRTRMIAEGVKLSSIGDLSKIPPQVVKALDETQKATADQDQIEVVLAINYGARNEIKRAVQKIVRDTLEGHVQKEQVTEQMITNYLDTSNWPDPDLFIRTSGEKRTSNFLLWQTSYTEFYFTDVLWPDFSPQHLLGAITEYQKREKRWGT